MTVDKPIHRSFGTPMSEWISRAGELDIDAVGLWQIVGNGREGFGLEHEGLSDFVRHCLLAHLTHCANPVRHRRDDQFLRTVQDHYGPSPERIADAIVVEWEADGRPNPDLGGLWLATSQIANHPQSEIKW